MIKMVFFHSIWKGNNIAGENDVKNDEKKSFRIQFFFVRAPCATQFGGVLSVIFPFPNLLR